ncbi:MAG: alpha/beta hydrolase [Gemmatimonadaceae bacterium]
MKTILVTVVLVYVAFAAFAWLVSDRMIFQPPSPSYHAGQLPIVMVPTDGGSIATLHLPNPSAAVTVLYAHGNAEDLGQLALFLEELRRAGFAVLAFDYRGYGMSTGGPPSAAGSSSDLEAVYHHAVKTLRIPPSRIVLYGRSVGSGPATDLAAHLPIGGLVLESAFVSAFRVLTKVTLLPFDRFHNLRHIRRVRAPILVIHGTADEVIPLSHGRLLYEAAGQPKQALWIEGAHHNDVPFVGGARYWSALTTFGHQVAAAAGAGATP